MAAFIMTSCQKENTATLSQETNQTELVSNISDDPIELADTEAAFVTEKGTVIGQLSLEDRNALPAMTPTRIARTGEAANSRSSLSISCGQTKYGNSGFYGSSLYNNRTYSNCYNGNSSFNAMDVEYEMTIFQESNVEIILDQLDRDLDIFLFTNSGGGLGHCLDASLKSNTNTDKITIHLLPGKYWIIIDGYNTAQVSNYRLRMNCQPLNNCMFDAGFENFFTGANITTADPANWDKYISGAALDAVVSTNRAYAGSKSLKLDWNNNYHEDNQPKVLAELGTKSSGMYEINFKMYIPSNNNAKIALHKYDSPRNTAIEFFFRKGRGFACRTKDRIIYLNGSYGQNRWLNVQFLVDLDNRRGELYVDNRLLHTWDTATFAYSSTALRNSIGGLQFHAYHNNSRFYIDDICFDELTNGPFIDSGN